MSLKQNSFIYSQVVSWGDMDAFGHVNNVVYYRYIENARIAYLDQVGLLSYPIHIVVASSQCKYLSPVTYPDILNIRVEVLELRNSAFSMRYLLWSEAQQKHIAEAEVVIVCVDQNTGQKVTMPEQLKRELLILKNNSIS
jgi:acyl-CoA thioester hydrolase